MPEQHISNAFRIEIGGKPLPPGVDVTRVEVEDHVHLPDAFSLTIRDAARTALADSAAKIGATAKISVLSDAAPGPEVLLDGEVTAIEAELHGGASYTIVRGYDQSHRLFRGRVTASYLNMTYSDVAEKVADRNHLGVGTIDSTSPTHPHITQANESDWTFLVRLAREVGHELTVSDGKLQFRAPGESTSAPGRKDLGADNPLALLAGSSLLGLRATVSAAEQVKEVEVRGWDPGAKRALVVTAAASTKVVENGSSTAEVARSFPAPPLVATGTPLSTEKDVELAANALAEEVAASQTEIEGRARGNPKLRAGTAVRIGLLGAPFDGKYVLTTTCHSFSPDEGYVTSFVISGRQDRSTLALASGGGGGLPSRIEGVAPAVVDDVNDPDQKCRVRLRLPWLSDDYVSDWTRVAQAGAGKSRGWLLLPEVGDEVLVSFDQGDVRRPFVLAGLYNDTDTPDVGPDPLIDRSNKSVTNRLFTSRKGHQLVFTDGDDECAVLVQSADKKLSVRLDQAQKKITIRSEGDLDIKVDGNIKIEAKGKLEMSGQSVTAEAQSSFSAKGAQVSVEGSGPVKVSGQPIQLN